MAFLSNLAHSKENNVWHDFTKKQRQRKRVWGSSSCLSERFLTTSVCSSFTLCLRRICCVWSTLSTVFVANGTCCSLAGYDSDNSIVSAYCPPCLPCTTPVLPFTQSFSWESPASLLLKTTLITACALYVSWPVKFTYIFIQVFVKEGTLMKVSRKSRQPRHLFLVNAASTLHRVRHINSTRWLLIVSIPVPSCNHGGVFKLSLCKLWSLSGLFLCPDWAIKSRVSWQDVSECWLPESALYWHHREAQQQLPRNFRIRVHLRTFMTLILPSMY